MKKPLFLILLMAALQCSAEEMAYTLSVLDEEYVSLSEASSTVNNETWDDPQVVIPIGFTFQLIDEVITDIIVSAPGSQMISSVVEDSVHFLEPYLSDIVDVGYDTASLSPMVYTTEGNPGSRIFKMEWRNVGFYEELFGPGTNEQRTNFQMWLYEGTNVIEYRYGENTITDPALVHFAGGPLVGLGMNADNVNGNGWEAFWVLSGDPTAPTVELFNNIKMFPPTLNAEPPAGTVYHFSPLFVSTSNPKSPELNIYPTIALEYVQLNWTGDLSQVLIYNELGALVKSESIMKGYNRLDVSALASGTYIIQINDDNQFLTTKFIKQ